MRQYTLSREIFIDKTVVGCPMGSILEDFKRYETWNYGIRKPGRETRGEKRARLGQWRRMGLETPVSELTPLGQRYGIDLLKRRQFSMFSGGLYNVRERGFEVGGNALLQEAESLRLL